MIVIKDYERLYLKSWEYNAARIISRLSELVIERGGRVKPTHPALASDFSLTCTVAIAEARLQKLEEWQCGNYTEHRAECISKIITDLNSLRRIENEPIKITHTTYITFVLDGYFYYYQVSDNPFSEFLGCKMPVVFGRYNSRAIMDIVDRKLWLTDTAMKCGFSEKEVDKKG